MFWSFNPVLNWSYLKVISGWLLLCAWPIYELEDVSWCLPVNKIKIFQICYTLVTWNLAEIQVSQGSPGRDFAFWQVTSFREGPVCSGPGGGAGKPVWNLLDASMKAVQVLCCLWSWIKTLVVNSLSLPCCLGVMILQPSEFWFKLLLESFWTQDE